VYRKLPGGVFSGWEDIPNSCCVNSITFGPSDEMLGINSAGNVYKYINGKWDGPIAAMSMPNLSGLSYSPATKLYYALTSRGQVLTMPAGGKWTPLAPDSPVPLTSVTVAS
jgi:hypothetical protein